MRRRRRIDVNFATLVLCGFALAFAGACNRDANGPATDAQQAARQLDDAWVATKIEAQYFATPDVKANDIDVAASNGVVTLTGTVASEAAKSRAVEIARTTDGVRDVQDRITVAEAPTATTGTLPTPEARDREAPPAPRAPDSETRAEPGESASSMDAAWTTTRIQSQFYLDPDIKGRNIDVTTRDGIVTLAGSVENDAQKQKAVQIARSTEGAREVRDELRVGPEPAATTSGATPAASSVDPERLVARVQSKFYQADTLRRSTIEVIADGSVITLSGTVPTEPQKREAVSLARNTDGVTEVRDELRVDPKMNPVAPLPVPEPTTPAIQPKHVWLTTKIQAQFYLDPAVRDSRIKVSTAEEGVVTLSGTVPSDAARQQALKIARETEGVTRVNDQLEVGPGGGTGR